MQAREFLDINGYFFSSWYQIPHVLWGAGLEKTSRLCKNSGLF